MNSEQLLSEIAKMIQANTQSDTAVRGVAKGRMGEPSDKEFREIQRLTGIESSPEDWFIVEAYASDNLVDRGRMRWHPNVLSQMSKQFAGRPAICDHKWSADSSKGFLIFPELCQEQSLDSATANLAGYGKFNRKIAKDEGYQWLKVTIVLPVTSNAANAVKSRTYNDLSTGTLLNNVRHICPNCSEAMGREVDFYERDEDGGWVCPHLIPTSFILWMDSMGFLDEDVQIADYCTLDGVNDCIELSFVTAGQLPAASVIRA